MIMTQLISRFYMKVVRAKATVYLKQQNQNNYIHKEHHVKGKRFTEQK